MSWKNFLKEEKNKDYFKSLEVFLDKEYQNESVFPKRDEVFRALDLCEYKDVKVVILGQDPYPGRDRKTGIPFANGLAFSVSKDSRIPQSLRNIYKEIEASLGIKNESHGDLSNWAKQGVLLLNNVLTVREGVVNSHKKQGWEEFTSNIFEKLNERPDPLIFVLWGGVAQKKEGQIKPHHTIFKTPHPSPLSAYKGFHGSDIFLKINNKLESLSQRKIDWEIK